MNVVGVHAINYYCEWSWPQKIINQDTKEVLYSCPMSQPYCNKDAALAGNTQCCNRDTAAKVYYDCISVEVKKPAETTPTITTPTTTTPAVVQPIEKIIDLCASVTCSYIKEICPDGFIAKCRPSCNKKTGKCGDCEPDCSRHKLVKTTIVGKIEESSSIQQIPAIKENTTKISAVKPTDTVMGRTDGSGEQPIVEDKNESPMEYGDEEEEEEEEQTRATTVEYALIAALIAVAEITQVTQLGDRVAYEFEFIDAELEASPKVVIRAEEGVSIGPAGGEMMVIKKGDNEFEVKERFNELVSTYNEKGEVVEGIDLEIGEDELVYDVTTSKKAKLFGLIPITMEIETKVDSELALISEKKPWWSVFAFGEESNVSASGDRYFATSQAGVIYYGSHNASEMDGGDFVVNDSGPLGK